MTAPTLDLFREAQTAVLAEYRLRRHCHRPNEAMVGLAHNYAAAYARGAMRGDSDEAQRAALARFEVADLYAHMIFIRGHVPGDRPVLRFWLRGTLAKVRVSA